MAFKNIFIKVSSILCLAFLSVMSDAQVTVSKPGDGLKNPTVVFNGVSGDNVLSGCVESDLKNCGWFDIAAAPPSDFRITGSAVGGTLTLNVAGVENFSISERIDSSNIPWTAHRAVDQILKRLFKIPGICSTKIAFCMEITKGVKEIYICDFDGKNPRKITSNDSLSVEPTWSPNNKTIAYTLYKGQSLFIAETDVQSLRSRYLVRMPGLNSGAAFAPTGGIMALTLSYEKSVDLYLKTVEGTSIKRLTADNSVEASPCWSPGGDKLCYVSDISKMPHLYIISKNGGPSSRLKTVPCSESVSPSWSGDDKIAYSARVDGAYTIAVTDLRKNTAEVVLKRGGNWERPSWAPDNRHVVCSYSAGGKYTLCIVDTWTGNVRPLLGGYNLSLPAWSKMF